MRSVTNTTSATPAIRLPQDFWEYPEESGASSTAGPPIQPSATRRGGALLDRFSSALAPYVTVVGLAAAAWPREKWCIYSAGEFSGSAIIDVAWAFDQWEFTREPAALEEIESLNRLLDLPAAEGLVVEFPDF